MIRRFNFSDNLSTPMNQTDIKDITDQIEEQEWLSPIAEGAQNAIGAAFEAGGEPGQKVKNFLHGTWLGHALHPVLTDIPIGAWTVAVLFDVIDAARGKEDLSRAADTAVGIGLCGAVGAATTGIADYQASGEQAPNSGLVHGALNGTATILFLTSLILRKRGSRNAGRGTALLGYGLMSAAAYLGGELVYGQRLGVDHAQREELPGEWVSVLPESDLPQHEAKRVETGGIRVLLVRRGDEIFAIGEVCSHLGGPLAEGELKCDSTECSIRCPWHGSRFDLQTGGVLDGPATYVQPKFETRVRDGKIEIKAAHGRPAES
jgi:nitrite reductase/ring-hydroxylating ferredoxin subunit/uncharacterized membrane protein